MKTMMRKVLITTCAALSLQSMLAQNDDTPAAGTRAKQKIAELKRAYYDDKLSLTESEAEKFWPLYDEYNTRRDAIRKELKKLIKQANTDSTLSDAQALRHITTLEQKRKEETELDSKFLKDSMPILGAKRTMMLVNLEREFQKTAMQKMRERRQQNAGRQGKGTRGGAPSNK